jgi:predicted P-loop ATPase
MMQNTFVGMMARLDQPGAKMDTVLILQGDQGFRKSTFFAQLLPPGLATDAQNFDFRKKDGLMMLAQHVAIEMGEAVHIRSENGYENLKQFLSQTTDTFRPPYGRELLEVPRHCIFFASANDENLFYDPTGTRRFYVIPVKRKMEDGEAVAIRDQLLAQAKHIYERFRASQDPEEFLDTRWWFEEDDPWEKARHRANQAYEDHHPWEDPIVTYCAEHAGKEITTTTLLTKTIDKPMGQISTGDQRVVARILKRMGCEMVNKRIDGVRRRVWIIPKDMAPQRVDTSEMPKDDTRDQYGWEYKDPDEK